MSTADQPEYPATRYTGIIDIRASKQGDQTIMREHRAEYRTADDSYCLVEEFFHKRPWSRTKATEDPISTRIIASASCCSEITIQFAADGEAVVGRLATEYMKETLNIKSISFDYKGAVFKIDYEAMGPYQRRYITTWFDSEFLYFEWKLFMMISGAVMGEGATGVDPSDKLIELIKDTQSWVTVNKPLRRESA